MQSYFVSSLVCDQMFFSELMKEASDIAGCFSSRARHLLHLHVATGMQRYVLRLRQCFRYDQKALVEEGRMLIEYITMNAIAIRKILKKYDKVKLLLVHYCNPSYMIIVDSLLFHIGSWLCKWEEF